MLHFHFKGDNPQPSEHESLPVTTRPGLPPNHYSNLKKQFQKSRRSRLRTFYAFLIFWKFDFYVCKFFSSFSSKLNWKLLHYIQTLSSEKKLKHFFRFFRKNEMGHHSLISFWTAFSYQMLVWFVPLKSPGIGFEPGSSVWPIL